MTLGLDLHRELNRTSHRARRHVLEMAGRGGCFVGAALSCVDLLTYLYQEVLQVTPGSCESRERDYFFLSKGHAVPALYAVLAEAGFFEAKRLEQHLEVGSPIYWHPNRSVPGVEFHSGSLGHALSVALGVAYEARCSGGTNRVFVLLGDGELDEGSVWEALLVAAALRLDNLYVLIDRNELQANVRTEELVPLEPLADKLRAFGCAVSETDGHSFPSLALTFASPPCRGQPRAIIARTVRGKGIPSLEARTDCWFVAKDPGALLDELELTFHAMESCS